MKKITLISIMLIFLSGCATWEKETLAYMGGSALLCGAVNAAMAPKKDDKSMHFALGGGLCSAAVGGYRLATRDENKEIIERDREINTLKMKLGAFKQEMKVGEGSNSFMETEIPDELKGLVKKQGQWKMFKMDKWEKTKKGFFIHHDKAAKLIPPKFIK